MNTQFKEQKKPITNMKISGLSQVIKEFQIKTIMKCQFASRW